MINGSMRCGHTLSQSSAAWRLRQTLNGRMGLYAKLREPKNFILLPYYFFSNYSPLSWFLSLK